MDIYTEHILKLDKENKISIEGFKSDKSELYLTDEYLKCPEDDVCEDVLGIDYNIAKRLIPILTQFVNETEEFPIILEKMKVEAKKQRLNQDVKCSLRIEGSFGFLCGHVHHCLMLNRSMNSSFLDKNTTNDFFLCKECPDPQKRVELLEIYHNQPNCDSCQVNMATKKIPTKMIREKKGIWIPFDKDMVMNQEFLMLCISCGSNW